MKKLKLVWEFSGIDALEIAKHHLLHMQQYLKRENIDPLQIDTELISEFSAITFIIIYDQFLDKIRSDLKPNHGFLVDVD